MFIWDFNAVFAVLLILFLALVFALRLSYTFIKETRGDGFMAGVLFRQCQYCGYVYVDYLKRSPCQCPRCLSYHDQ